MDPTMRSTARMTRAAPLVQGLPLGEVALDVQERRGGEAGGGHDASLVPADVRRMGDNPPRLTWVPPVSPRAHGAEAADREDGRRGLAFRRDDDLHEPVLAQG